MPRTGAVRGSSSADLARLLRDASRQSVKVTFTGSDGATATYAQDGKGDTVYSSGSAQIFTTPKGTTACSSRAGTTTCAEASPSGDAALPQAFVALSIGEQAYLRELAGHGVTSTKSIAGRTVRCVTFTPADLPDTGAGSAGAPFNGSATYCNDQLTGTLMEISGTDDAGTPSTSFVVTSFATPGADDFTLPAAASTSTAPASGTTPSTIRGGG